MRTIDKIVSCMYVCGTLTNRVFFFPPSIIDGELIDFRVPTNSKFFQEELSKININTELQIAWHDAVLEFIKDNEDVYDPRKVIGSGQASMKKAIVDKINLFFNR